MIFSLLKWLTALCRMAVAPTASNRRTPVRKGATALEYLFVISLILVVLIAGVQSVANSTKGLFNKSNDATSKKSN
ncbi:MAG: hypothetical protein FJ271_13040 [Planctomycetes bacterium]|nr:hypothetical protein [Planctomycetota bacterium]